VREPFHAAVVIHNGGGLYLQQEVLVEVVVFHHADIVSG
jgi:hypothetical protein